VYGDYIKKNKVALFASDSINEFGWAGTTSTPESASSSPK
jgi:hypothetical protein